MTVEMRKLEERFGVSFVDIRSQCLPIPSTSERVLEGLRKGLLHSCLECLVKVIEQLLCSSTTSSTRFSWRLPRGLYPLKASPSKSSYSSEEEGIQTKVLNLPMKVLDDLNICEERAILRAEPHLSSQPTVMQEFGKTWWRRKADKYRRVVETMFGTEHVVLYSSVERSLSLYYVGSEFKFQLQGVADLVAIFSICCKTGRAEKESCVPNTVLFEFTIYERFENIVPRVIAYASSLYSEYGFLTMPVIVIMRDFEEDVVERALLLLNSNEAGFTNVLKDSMKRLEALLSRRARPRKASEEICTQCDIELRRRCPYLH